MTLSGKRLIRAGNRVPAGPARLTSACADRLTWAIVAVIAASYFLGLTPGHVFAQDDFAAYIMHAANLVEHRPYTAIHYVPNPEAPWVSPANGYPPVYPLLLAPVYWRWGLDLRAMTVFTFAIFLATFAKWVQPLVSPKLRVIALILVGLNPAFWNYRDLIASEFPYLMISFLTLVAVRRAYADLEIAEWRPGWACLVAILLYVSYGTRTIGIALPIAMALADMSKFKRPSRFLILVLSLLAVFIVLQATMITSPKGYLSVAHISARAILDNVWFYARSLSYAWQNGFSKPSQIVLAFVLTGFAVFGFARHVLRERSTDEFYLLVYLAILITWSAQIGIRGLLPVLPLCLTYVLVGIADLVGYFRQRAATHALAGVIAIGIAITYLGALRQAPWQAAVANVMDPSAQELFSFLRKETTPSDLFVFSKPRSIALFTARPTASLGPEESANDSTEFLKRSGAKFLIQTGWNPSSYNRPLTGNQDLLTEVFRNRDFTVFRVRFEDAQPR